MTRQPSLLLGGRIIKNDYKLSGGGGEREQIYEQFNGVI